MFRDKCWNNGGFALVLCVVDLLEISVFLREYPQIKVCVLVGLKGRGDDEVLPRGKTKAAAHLAQVDEGLRTSCRIAAEEEVFLQVHVLKARVLRNDSKYPCNSLLF